MGKKGGNCQRHHSFYVGYDDICYATDRKKSVMAFIYDHEKQIAAVQFQIKKGNNMSRCWELMFIKTKGQLVIEYEDSASCAGSISGSEQKDLLSTPGIIKSIIDHGYSYTPEGCLPLKSCPFVIDEESKELVSSYITRLLIPAPHEKPGKWKPLVYVPVSRIKKTHIVTKDLSRRLKGVAHIVYLQNRCIDKQMRKQFRRIHLGTRHVTVIYPAGASGDRFNNVEHFRIPTTMDDTGRIICQIIHFVNATTGISSYSFEPLLNSILTRKIQKLREELVTEKSTRMEAEKEVIHLRQAEIHLREDITEKVMSDAEEIIASYEEDIAELKDTNYEIRMKMQGLEVENERMRIRQKNPNQIPVLYFGKEKEFYIGEISDLLMSVLEDSLTNIPEKSRKHDIVTDILSANGYRHIGLTRNEKVRHLLKNYTGMTGRVREGLEALGFHVEETSGHFKITYFGDKRYLAVLGSTPSDVRSGKNNAALIARIAF